MKTCRKCKQDKLESSFPFRKDTQRFTARCKSCVHARQAGWLRQYRRAQAGPLPDNINQVVLSQRETLLRRINKRTVRVGDCKEWPSAKARGGYPFIFVKVEGVWFQIGTHRIIAALFHGLNLLDGDALACHHCDNRACCEEKHIFVGSHADNQHDAQKKGRLRGNTKQGPRPKRIAA